MSFSGDTKGELCREGLSRRCCAQAEAYGVLLFCNTFQPGEIRITTECDPLKERLPALFRRAFRVSFDVTPADEGGKGSFLIRDREKIARICEVFGIAWDSAVSLHLNFAVLEEDHCRAAFLRGAFLAGGSVTDPEKGYHLELATSHGAVSRETLALMGEMGLQPKDTTRSANYVLYFKQSDRIEDFLTTIGAGVSAMRVMNARAEKTLRGSVNRRVNCDAANLDKVVSAAQEQIEAIGRLRERGMLEGLSPKLREAAQLRTGHPELTLTQLAELCAPPVTKSCLNHRLRKLMELSRGES